MWLLTLLAGCASVRADLQAARDAALATPGPAPEGWAPDAVLHLSARVLDDVVSAAIAEHGRLTATLAVGPLALTPDLRVTSLEIGPGRACAECLGLSLALDGQLAWTAPFLSGSAPVRATGELEAVFGVARDEALGFTVSVHPRDLHDLSVSIGGVGAALGDLDRTVADWLEAGLLAGVPAVGVATIGGPTVPIRAVRVVPDGPTVQIHALTAVPSPGRVAVDGPRPNDGWRLDLAWDSLLALARAEVFRDPGSRGLLAEPTALSLGPDGFSLGLRLWRTSGRGWWRDYRVSGTAAVADGRLALSAGRVEELGHSPGAAWADPLAALAEGLILRSIEAAVDQTLPARRVDRIGGQVAEVRMEALEPVDGALRVRGALTLREARGPRRDRRPRRRPTPAADRGATLRTGTSGGRRCAASPSPACSSGPVAGPPLGRCGSPLWTARPRSRPAPRCRPRSARSPCPATPRRRPICSR